MQFEGFLPQVNEIYRYDFSNAREIGGLRWRSNAFAYRTPERQSTEAPEATAMHNWLRAGGYTSSLSR